MPVVLYEPIAGEVECGTCKHFAQIGGTDYWGQCRRHGPIGQKEATGAFEAIWPNVSGNDWCGDYGRAVIDKDGHRVRIA